MEERKFYLGFSLVSGVGPKTFLSLLKYFKTAKRAWNANTKELQKAGLGEKLIIKFDKSREKINISEYLKILKHKKISYIAFCDNEYPKLLKEIPNPPIVLFIKGDFRKIDFGRTIGIVGTRKITSYGRAVTEIFSSELSASGFVVVSGLAMGVDSQAALSAIGSGGKTIAVMGNGVDICIPVSNEKLYDKILDGNGIIISEFPLGFSPTTGSFPSRNRIIAGLSLGVLVTEGAKDSGSLITADYAFKFNRKVFAVPGPITSSLSVAPLKLIEKGAVLVTSATDITKIFNSQFLIPNEFSKFQFSKKDKIRAQDITKEEEKILALLQNESLGFDEIVRKLKMYPPNAGSLLSIMEIKGLVKSTKEKYEILR